MPSAYGGTDIISYLQRKYIIRQRRISYRQGRYIIEKLRISLYNYIKGVIWMTDHKLIFLKSTFSKYDVQFSENFTKATLINPFYEENITVYYYDDDDFTPFCVCFSFQHCHLMDQEDVIEWINQIIAGNKFAIEFFKNGQNCFGSEIDSKELLDLSYEKLEQFTGYYGLTRLLSIVDTFKIRGWNNQHNFDATFVCEDNGYILIKKL